VGRSDLSRNDLSQRQLVILREMLNSPDGARQILEDAIVDRDCAWRLGDAMSRTATLLSGSASPTKKKRRRSKMGMGGLREMLKALKKTHPPPPLPPSSASASTASSIDKSKPSSSHSDTPSPCNGDYQFRINRVNGKSTTRPAFTI
jgi:serine/arginine repetitive matrix protein 2